MTEDTKWRNRARLETWVHGKGGSIEFRSAAEWIVDDERGWTVTATIADPPGTWIVAETAVSIEEACSRVIERFATAGHSIP